MPFDYPARFIDHTLLKPDTTADQIRQLCEEAVEYGFASVCIPPSFISLASGLLYGSDVEVCTVVGFPLGYATTEVKVSETADAVAKGASEIDMVINLGMALSGDLEGVEREIRQVVEAAGNAKVKVIIECCYLTDALKASLTERVFRAGAAYVKTSTGFGFGGATLDDVALMSRIARGRIGIKAAGGIRDWATCRAFIDAGATRIGASAGVAIVDEWRREQGL